MTDRPTLDNTTRPEPDIQDALIKERPEAEPDTDNTTSLDPRAPDDDLTERPDETGATANVTDTPDTAGTLK